MLFHNKKTLHLILHTREMQIKTVMRGHYTPIRVTPILTPRMTPNADKGVERQVPSFPGSRNAKCSRTCVTQWGPCRENGLLPHDRSEQSYSLGFPEAVENVGPHRKVLYTGRYGHLIHDCYNLCTTDRSSTRSLITQLRPIKTTEY